MRWLEQNSLQDKLGEIGLLEETSCWLTPAWRWSLECFSQPLWCRHRFAEKDLVCLSYTMQKPCLLGTTKRVGFVDRKKFAAKTSDKGEGTVVVPVRLSIKYNVSADAFSNNAFDPLLNLRPSQLVRYTIILLYIRACTTAEPAHPPHGLR